MNKKTPSKKVTSKHISATLSDETIRQVRLRVDLLNDFLKNGVPEGFTAHLLQSTFLAYSDGKEITSRTRPAIANKTAQVSEIDSENKDSASEIVKCLAYLKWKREVVIAKQKLLTDVNEPEVSNEKNITKNTSKSKTKGELNQVIRAQAELIKSLAQELLLQRSANNELIDHIKAVDHHHNMTLRPYYSEHQDKLYKSRKKNSLDLRTIISSLNEILKELDEVFINKTNNIVSIWDK